MKTNCWLILGITLATTAALAQVNTNLPPIPPPVITTPGAPPAAPMTVTADISTNTPAKKATTKPTKKKTVKKTTKPATKSAAKPAEKKTPAAPVNLVAGPATVDGEHVNLRGQASLKSEVIGHVQKGDAVTVISQIDIQKPKAGEPAQWAKIALPASVKVWVDAKYVDASNNVVKAKKLNLRGGPGENYSVLGTLEKGASITPVTTKENWTQIEAPQSAYAYVAASYLKQGAIDTTTPVAPVTTPEAVPTTPVVVPTPTTVAETTPIAPPATTPPTTTDTAPVTPPVTTPPPVTPPPMTPVATLPQPTLVEEDTNLPPPPPRIVTHEGMVRHSVSPVSPTDYELFDPANNKAINYLSSTTTNLNLSRYNGLHITVTGEEAMDVRWKDTPVITIQKIYVLGGGKPTEDKPASDKPDMKPVKKHWWSK